MLDLNKIGEDLFNKIRGRFKNVTIGDQEGTVTNVPEDARFFDFAYGENGNVSVSLSEKDGVVVMFNNDLFTKENSIQKSNWYSFLKELRGFARKRLLNFDTRDITKSNLNKRDYKFLANNSGDETMTESKLYGTGRTSYQNVDSARIVIKHTENINQELATGRTQKIGTIHIESSEGERFKYPYKHLNGARAMARHVAEGGNAYDDFGKHIVGMSEELAKLRKFKNYMSRNSVMAEGLGEYTQAVNDRIETVKHTIETLQRKNVYAEAIANFESTILEEVPEDISSNWIEQLTIKQFNEELKDVFPFVYRVVSEYTKTKELGPEDILGERMVDGKPHCPEACCGSPVEECVCGPECEHCNCHMINKESIIENLDKFRELYRKGISDDDDAVVLRELINIINDDALWSDEYPELKKFVGKSPHDDSDIVTAEKIPGSTADEKIEAIVTTINDDKWEAEVADHLMKQYSMSEGMEEDGEHQTEFEYIGDDGEEQMGDLFYKVVNGKVDPNSLRGEADPMSAPNGGNAKVDDEFATMMVEPGGDYHEEALEYAQEDYDDKQKGIPTETDIEDDFEGMMGQFADNEGKPKDHNKDGKIDSKDYLKARDKAIKKAMGKDDEELDEKQKTPIGEFIMSHFDRETGEFPKGETAVLTMVEKDYGEMYIEPAKKFIEKLQATVEAYKMRANPQQIDQEQAQIEHERMKELAGLR